MENALQNALKKAIKNNTPAWYDDEASTQATEPVTQPATLKENSMQTTHIENKKQDELHLGEKVRKIYEMLVLCPNASCVELEQRLRDAGHAWYDSLSGQLKQLYDRGLVVRVKRASEGEGRRAAYRYWPIANTFEEAMRARKEAQRNKAATPPKTASFPINKEKAVKEKAMHRLMPTQVTREVVPTLMPTQVTREVVPMQEITQESHQKVMRRVGGFDAKAQVERMSVVEARAVYAELKAIFG